MIKTQEQVILQALQNGEKLTQRIAGYHYHVSRLAAVIGKLEAKGHKIRHDYPVVKTIYGKAAIAEYSLIK